MAEIAKSLTVHEVEQLVALRLALEDAVFRAKGATKYRRGPAIVALDATVERASSIVAVTRGITIPTNGKLDDLISRLKQDLKSSWNPAVLPDIRHLRRARNASQHEGLEPDRDQVPLWASAASVYVSTLIDAQFQVDIQRVVLSDAIRDPYLRQCLREAEAARDAGELSSCVDKIKVAYRDASARWSRLRGGGPHGFPSMQSDLVDKKSFDFLNGRLNNVQLILEAGAFSQDLAEAEWFILALNEQSDVLHADDAERLLSFAFDWVVEYERAASSWTPNRRYSAAVARRKVRSEDGQSRIDECVSVDLYHGQLRALFRIAGVPGEDDYSAWRRVVSDLLPTPHAGQRWVVFDDGTVEIRKNVEAATDMSNDVEILSSALRQADLVIQEKREAAIQEEIRARQTQDNYVQSVNAIRAEIPDWVETIQWSNDWVGGGSSEQVLITLSKEVLHMKFGERTPGSFFDDRNSIRELILAHELVDQCYGTAGPGDLGITPVLTGEQLISVFRDVDTVVHKQLEILRREQEVRNAALVAAKAAIAAKLAARP